MVYEGRIPTPLIPSLPGGEKLLLRLGNRLVERVRRRLELVAAAGVAEADNLAAIQRKAVRADRLAGPGAGVVDAVLEAKLVRQGLGLLRQLLGLGDGLFDPADHVEGGFRQVVVFALDDALEAGDGVFDVDQLAGRAGEDFGDVEGL